MYLDLDGDILPEEFTDEGPKHPCIYFRAPTWGDSDEAAELAADSEYSYGHWLIAMCASGVGGDFALCLHEATRGVANHPWPDEPGARLTVLKGFAAPDLRAAVQFVNALSNPSSDEVGESVAPAG